MMKLMRTDDEAAYAGEASSSPQPQQPQFPISKTAINSAVVAATSSTVAVPEPLPIDLRERLKLIVFLLSQFKVHYLSWLKSPAQLPDYWLRFTPIYEELQKFPEFESSSTDGNVNDLNQWIICEAIKTAYQYHRKLIITVNEKAGLNYHLSGKQFNVYMVKKKMDKSINLKPNIANGGSDSSADENDSWDSSEEMERKKKLPIDPKGRKLLGSIKLPNKDKLCVSLPLYTNRIKAELEFHIVLVDAVEEDDDDKSTKSSPAHEYDQIIISEYAISGFKGCQKVDEKMKFTDEDNELVSFGVDISLKWQIDSEDYCANIADPITILRKLPGALFQLGTYYWTFYVEFYRWAATECFDQNVRYCAMQVFHELAVQLTPAILNNEMQDIFVDMYCGRYPTMSELDVPESDYQIEAVSILDNIVFVFQALSTDEQVMFCRRMLPQAEILLKTRFHYIQRLFAMMDRAIGSMSEDQIEEMVLPFTIEALYYLSLVRDPAKAFSDPRTPKISWTLVQAFASQLTRLVVECIDRAKPQNWPVISIEHKDMAAVKRNMNQLVRSLFKPSSIRFLQAIYTALHEHDILTYAQLDTFRTPNRLALIRKWLPAPAIEAVPLGEGNPPSS